MRDRGGGWGKPRRWPQLRVDLVTTGSLMQHGGLNSVHAHADAYRTHSALSHANSALSACMGSQPRTMPVACTDRQADSWLVDAMSMSIPMRVGMRVQIRVGN